MTVPEPAPAACRARRRGPHKPPLPAWALRDLRNRGHAALTLAARADLKAGAGTEQTVTVPPPKSASTTPPAFASALRPGKSPGRRLRRGRLRPCPAGPGIPGRPGPAPCTQPIWPRRRSQPGVPQSCSSSTGSRTTVEDHITGQPKTRQSSRSAVPSGELHPIENAFVRDHQLVDLSSPTVRTELRRADAILLFEWLKTVDMSSVPTTHRQRSRPSRTCLRAWCTSQTSPVSRRRRAAEGWGDPVPSWLMI